MNRQNLCDEVIEYIVALDQDDFSELTIGKIAREFKVHQSYLSRKFKKNKQVLLSDFLNAERIVRAEALLKERKDLTVFEISNRVGFETCFYFRRLFKRKNGMTPGIYKQKFDFSEKP